MERWEFCCATHGCDSNIENISCTALSATVAGSFGEQTTAMTAACSMKAPPWTIHYL